MDTYVNFESSYVMGMETLNWVHEWFGLDSPEYKETVEVFVEYHKKEEHFYLLKLSAPGIEYENDEF